MAIADDLRAEVEPLLDSGLADLSIKRAGPHYGLGPRYGWPLDKDFSGVLIAGWEGRSSSSMLVLMAQIGIVHEPLERLVKQLGAAPLSSRISHQRGLWNLVPQSEHLSPYPGVVFQTSLDNERIAEIAIGWVRDYGLPWVASLADLDLLDCLITVGASRGGEDVHDMVRAPLTAYLRGDVPLARTRLESYVEAWSRRQDEWGDKFRAFAERARLLLQ